MNTTIIRRAMLLMLFLCSASRADEVGLATGCNSSFFKSWPDRVTKYQKTDIVNPVEIFIRKDFTGFFGLYSSIGYTKRSATAFIQKANIDESTGTIKLGGTETFEDVRNYLAIEVCPVVFHRIGQIRLDTRAGLTGTIYLNESVGFESEPVQIDRNDNCSPFVVALTGSIGCGYAFNDRFTIGLRSGLSRTITDIFKYQRAGTDIYFVNWHNVLYASFDF
jgi:hypothetical protein